MNIKQGVVGIIVCCICVSSFAELRESSENKHNTGKKLNVYFFGHSLVYHTNVTLPTSKDHTSIPFWLKRLTDAAGYDYTTDGQFGFLRNHAELPPRSQWGFVNVASGWKRSFAESSYDAVVLTPGNFIQYQRAHLPYDGDMVSPLSATQKIVDFVRKVSPKSTFYIYENWPDMGGYAPDFPDKLPSSDRLQAYYLYTKNEYHDWWLDYQDQLNRALPGGNVKLIPVGPILISLISETPLKEIPFKQLFEDNAPHGRPNIYFLAAMIHYSALFREAAPKNFTDFEALHPHIRANYAAVVDRVWEELTAFNESGKSRLW